jgi:hypothetical protein
MQFLPKHRNQVDQNIDDTNEEKAAVTRPVAPASVKRSRASVPKTSGCEAVVERVEGEGEDVLCVMYLVSAVMKEGEKSVNKRRRRKTKHM